MFEYSGLCLGIGNIPIGVLMAVGETFSSVLSYTFLKTTKASSKD